MSSGQQEPNSGQLAVDPANAQNGFELYAELTFNGHQIGPEDHLKVIERALAVGLEPKLYKEAQKYAKTHLSSDHLPGALLSVAHSAVKGLRLPDGNYYGAYDNRSDSVEKITTVSKVGFATAYELLRYEGLSLDLLQAGYALVRELQARATYEIDPGELTDVAVRYLESMSDYDEAKSNLPQMYVDQAQTAQWDEKGQKTKVKLVKQAFSMVGVDSTNAVGVCLSVYDMLPSDYSAEVLNRAIEVTKDADRTSPVELVRRRFWLGKSVVTKPSDFDIRRDKLAEFVEGRIERLAFLSSKQAIVKEVVELHDPERATEIWKTSGKNIISQYIHSSKNDATAEHYYLSKLPELKQHFDLFAAIAPNDVVKELKSSLKAKLANAKVRA